MSKTSQNLRSNPRFGYGYGLHHYFATSVADWRVSTDLEDLIKQMKSLGYPFAVWLVPGPSTAAYQIKGYAPVVDGSARIAVFHFEEDITDA